MGQDTEDSGRGHPAVSENLTGLTLPVLGILCFVTLLTPRGFDLGCDQILLLPLLRSWVFSCGYLLPNSGRFRDSGFLQGLGLGIFFTVVSST